MIPLKTDRPIRSPILVNHLLIVVNFLVAVLLAYLGAEKPELAKQLLDTFHLAGDKPRLWQFVSYQFLHDQQGISHLFFNMLFLWVFGQNLEDRLGRIGYLAFYLAGGAFAGLMHVLVAHNPVIGASGSIAAVTGAYLALFPRSRILVLWVFILITWFQIPSLWFIGFSFARDLFLQLKGGTERVAYMAHIGGNLFGFFTGMTLLWTGLLKHEPFDMTHLLKQAYRRRKFKAATARSASPWRADAARQLKAKEKLTPEAQALETKRVEITRLASEHQLPEATSKYLSVLEANPDFVLSQQVQLDLANQLTSEGKHGAAARAYELFLEKHKQYRDLPQVQLMLGLIYTRYLGKRGRAKELVLAAGERLSDGPYAQLAQTLREELGL